MLALSPETVLHSLQQVLRSTAQPFITCSVSVHMTQTLSETVQRAYSQGWTSVEAAIKGGAKWISENYVNSRMARQNTLL